MREYSRILIEEYCMEHDSAKSRRLEKLERKSYDLSVVGTDSDAIFLEKLIAEEKNPELKEALEDLNDYLFNW